MEEGRGRGDATASQCVSRFWNMVPTMETPMARPRARRKEYLWIWECVSEGNGGWNESSGGCGGEVKWEDGAGATYMPAAFPTSSAATCACIAMTPAMRIMPCRRCQLLAKRRVSALGRKSESTSPDLFFQ